jgi:Protein of unknown function (DUF3489)
MTIATQVITALNKLAARATADIESLVREAYEMGREDMRKELLTLLHPSPRQTDAPPTVAPTKAPPGTVRPAILNMIEQSSGVSTEQIMTATGFKENSVRGTLSTLHKERKIARNAEGQWIAPIKTAADQSMEEAS